MHEIHVYHVDAFTNEPFSGKPAGVVPDATGLDAKVMQKVARELNFRLYSGQMLELCR